MTVWDQRPYPFRHPGLKVIRRDLFANGPEPDPSFQAIVSVSTIEHLGIGAYGDTVIGDADRRGVSRLWDMLRPGGRLIATVPAGRRALQRGYRVYDPAALAEVFPQRASVRWFAKRGRGAVWGEIPEQDVSELVFEAPAAALPVEGMAVVVCEKPLA